MRKTLLALQQFIDNLEKIADQLNNLHHPHDEFLGDGKGAGGLDSGLFSHLVRNWKITPTSFEASLQSEVDIDQSYIVMT